MVNPSRKVIVLLKRVGTEQCLVVKRGDMSSVYAIFADSIKIEDLRKTEAKGTKK